MIKTKPFLRILLLLFVGIAMLVIPSYTFSDSSEVAPKPGKKETCPVCGMFVSLYPDWVASITYTDGFTHYFDGTKDLFKYLQDIKKWGPDRRKENIIAIWVTNYYTLHPMDAKTAIYVIGSDVLGPMGHELIPLQTREEANEFLQDHDGKKVITFNAVTRQMIIDLDKGIFGP